MKHTISLLNKEAASRNSKHFLTAASLSLLALTLFLSSSLPQLVHARSTFIPIGWTLSFDSPSTEIKALAVYNGELFAGGSDIGQINGRLYRYNGTTWTDTNFSSAIGVPVDFVETLKAFNGRLYIGTRVDVEGTTFARVYYYDGTAFVQDFSPSGQAGYSGIEALAIHNDTLYAANGSPIGEVYQRIGDNNWVTVGSAIEPGSPVRALASFNGSLFAGTGAGGNQAKVWRWTGSSWALEKNLSSDFGLPQDGVFSLAAYNGNLYVGLAGPGSTSPIFAYDGTNWSLSISFPGCNSARLAVIGNELWAGTYCQGQVYRLQGSIWSANGATGEDGILDLAQYGQFVFAGTFSDGHIYSTTAPTNSPLTVNAGGPYSVNEGGNIVVTATSDAPNFAWDFDNNGTFETPGQSATFSAAGLDGPSSHIIGVQVTDSGGLSAIAQTTVEVLNVLPTANAGFDQTVYRNDIIALSGTWMDPAGSLDDPYSWEWDKTGDGSVDSSGIASYGSVVAETTTFAAEGIYTLTFQVTDKDDGVDSASLAVTVLNRPPDCSAASPSVSTLWPPNHQFVPVNVLGVTDPEGDTVSLTIDRIWQDEPVNTKGDGNFTPDGQGLGTSTAEVRAERVGSKKEPGNGRVYHIGFTATDGHSGSCLGEVLVKVPHDQGGAPVDDGAAYDSTVP